jgi:putative heme-binding domain-containing protein
MKNSRKGAKDAKESRALPWRSLRLCASLLLLGVLHPTARAQQDARVPDPDPEQERRSFQVADGFEVNLFAADPLLAKPIQMNFDPAGRLWVACSEVYPHIKPGQKANDKIIILEDRDGDGRADKTTVFADGLLIPTGVEPGDGGAYVADSTELLHLADTDGDGRADRRRVVLSGFGTEDTHHILHTLRWGPDGELYFNQSVYIHSHIETPHGVRRLNGGGIWRLRPETLDLQVFVRGFVNTWGHHFDRWGQSFVTDGAYGEGVNYGMPGAYYFWAVGATRILEGLNPGSPKHCGCEIVSGRHLPPDWQGNVLTNDFRGHRVCRFVLSENGAGYSSQEKAEVIKTNHPAFRPVDIKMGPDGAIYIADWYNPIIQHGEVDFRDPRRDHTHGRIWRVTAKGRTVVPRPRLVSAPVEDLLEALKAPEDWTRHQAKRVLKERGAKAVVSSLTGWVRRLDAADPNHEHHLLEALWTYQSLDVVEAELLTTLLHARDHHVRAAATRVLAEWGPRLAHPLDLLAARVPDDHPQVRLEAVRGLGSIHDVRAAETAMQALDRPVDKFLDYALWLTARELEPYWMPAVQKGQCDFGGRVQHLIFALQAVGSPAVVRPLVELVRAGKVPAEREEGVLTVIAGLGGPAELTMILDGILATDPKGLDRRATLLTALAHAVQQRGARPAGDLGRIAHLLSADNDAVRAAAARLVGLWHLEACRSQLMALARGDATSDTVRLAAVDGLTYLGGAESRRILEDLSAPTQPASRRRMAVVALTAVDLDSAARRAVEVLASTPEGDDPSAVFGAFLQRKRGAVALAAALAHHKLPRDVAKMGVRSVRTSSLEGAPLLAALTQAGSLTTGPRVLSAAEMKELVHAVQQHGNAARGEAIYRRKEQTCLKCHSIAGAGGQVGPDLVSIGASAPIDYLIESLLLPNKAVKENYHALVVGTRDGRLLTGIKVRETTTELILRDAEDKELAIPKSAIEEKSMGGSLMPDGLTDTLTQAELVDLVRFLSELGKVGPYSVSKARAARRWQVLEFTPQAQQHLRRTGVAAAAQEHPALVWIPAYSQVAGALPLDDVPVFPVAEPIAPPGTTMGFARCQLDCTTAGKVKLVLNDAAALGLWLDKVPIEAKEQVNVDLTPGIHTLTLAITRGQRRQPLRLELEEVPESPARVRIVSGK